MSVLMFVDDRPAARGESWPAADAIDRFGKLTAGDETATAFAAYRPGTVDEVFVDEVARRFELAKGRGGRGVLLVLTGVRDATLAERLYRDRAVPVYAAFCAARDDGREPFRRTAGVTAMHGWRPPTDDADVVVSAVCFANALSDGYRTYCDELRDVRSAAAAEHGVYASVMDAFGDGVRAVEPVLDAVLEQLCGATERDPSAAAADRWMSPSAVVEHGDRAAEDSLSLPAAADYLERTTRMAASFAATFWRDLAGRPTAVDRVLAGCLIGNLRNAPELDHVSDEHFEIVLNAKFIGTRRWRGPPSQPPAPSLFPPDVRKLCARFLAVDHLTDLMAATGVRDNDGGVSDRSHVEHLERYVLPQRLVEYASRHRRHEVRYFELTDTLVFMFTDGDRGELVERNHRHRFVGPRNVKEFHDRLFRADDDGAASDGVDCHGRPSPVNDPNGFVYRDFGYAEFEDNTVTYVSADGVTKVLAEVYRLRENDGEEPADDETRYRTKVECGEFWVTVHSETSSGSGARTELVMGRADVTAVAVTRRAGKFDVFARPPDDDDDDGRPTLECREQDAVAIVDTADGTRIVANYGDLDDFVCEVHVSDGARMRTRLGPAIECCPGDRPRKTAGCRKYLVCRRDLSGYEFVDGGHDRSREPSRAAAAFAVRTLVPNPFDGRTSGLVDKALSDHFDALRTLADRLNDATGPGRPTPAPAER